MQYLYMYNNEDLTFQYVKGILLREVFILPIQAEQCCVIAHNTGKCLIKEGDIIDLIKIKESLERSKITVEITNEKL